MTITNIIIIIMKKLEILRELPKRDTKKKFLKEIKSAPPVST